MYSRMVVALLLCVGILSHGAFAQGTVDGSDNDASSKVELEPQPCCGGPGSHKWEVYRVVNDLVVDYRQILVRKPVISRAVIPCSDGGDRLDIIIVVFGDDIEFSKAPTHKDGQPYFFAKVPDVGFISVAQHTEGERWVFRLGDVFVEKNWPVIPTVTVIGWEYAAEDGTMLQQGTMPVTNDVWARRSCKGEDGAVVSRLMYGGSAVAWAELEEEWKSVDWLKVPMPEESGQFCLWPRLPGATYKVTVGDQVYEGTVPSDAKPVHAGSTDT